MIGARPFAAMLAAVLAAVFTLCAASAQAQQMYRWTDEKGGVHITDTPPPPSAKDVQKQRPATFGTGSSQPPYELALAMKDFPVTLYTAPNCNEPCAKARAALNNRGVPFKEIQVWDKESNQELRRVSGSAEVPVLVVGASVQKGYEQGAFDTLLDSARYPRAGVLPARNQPAPKPPEDVSPGRRPAEPPKAEDEPKPAGPYAPHFSK
jgi:glutaredoxin